jgi:DNA repair exonuclease SbcCD ATPase subunit
MRHLYRREEFWSDFADKQPEIDQHACIVQFIGVAEKLFSSDYGDLVQENKTIWELQAQRDQFMSVLDEISKELIGAQELGVALTPESLSAAKSRQEDEAKTLIQRRQEFLEGLRSNVEQASESSQKALPDVSSISDELVRLETEYGDHETRARKIYARIEDIKILQNLLRDELSKLERATEAGAVLADLKVTHCPACDQPIEKHTSDDKCYVCGREIDEEQKQAANKRLIFEKEQIENELEESKQLLENLTADYKQSLATRDSIREALSSLRAKLRPVRQAAAALLPPELFLVDVEYGRVQEKVKQLSRIETVLGRRETLASEILRIQGELAALNASVTEKANAIDLETAADRLRDGFNTYLNRVFTLNPNSWLGQSVSVRIGERTLRFKVGDGNWKTKLGGTQRLYFFLAYHYALINLVRFDDARFPGFVMLDFPATFEDGTTVADKENFLLEPFVDLLKSKEFEGCQVIAAGRSFEGMKDVHRIELSKIWK